jgi:hypothetical protein
MDIKFKIWNINLSLQTYETNVEFSETQGAKQKTNKNATKINFF